MYSLEVIKAINEHPESFEPYAQAVEADREAELREELARFVALFGRTTATDDVPCSECGKRYDTSGYGGNDY